MAIEIEERFQSRKSRFNIGGAGGMLHQERIYLVHNSDDDAAIRVALDAFIPYIVEGLVRGIIDLDQLGPGTWLAVAPFDPQGGTNPQAPETGDVLGWTVDTGGATAHRTQSIATRNRYKSGGGTARDFKGAIGVTKDNVEGVDIVVPNLILKKKAYLSFGQFTTGYVKTMARLTGKMNNAPFHGFFARELLFLGGSAAPRGTKDVEVEYSFSGSENVTGLSQGDITGINKDGHDYLWVHYEQFSDPTAKAIVQRPESAHVEQVYYEADFSLLGIGV